MPRIIRVRTYSYVPRRGAQQQSAIRALWYTRYLVPAYRYNGAALRTEYPDSDTRTQLSVLQVSARYLLCTLVFYTWYEYNTRYQVRRTGILVFWYFGILVYGYRYPVRTSTRYQVPGMPVPRTQQIESKKPSKIEKAGRDGLCNERMKPGSLDFTGMPGKTR